MFHHVDATAEPCLKYTVSCSEQLMPEAQHLHQTPEGVQFSAFSSEDLSLTERHIQHFGLLTKCILNSLILYNICAVMYSILTFFPMSVNHGNVFIKADY